MSRHTTNLKGVIYRDCITNGKADKVYYIRYKDKNKKTIELKIGKYSEGIREAYCDQKRNEILTIQRNGEIPPIIAKRKKITIISIENIANNYFSDKPKINKTVISYYKNHIMPFFQDYDFENISREDISKFTNILKLKNVSKTNKPLASKTMNDILNILKAITKYGLKNDLIKNDFTKYINLFDVDNTRERFLTKEEIQLLYDKTIKDETIYLFFKLALNTGARLATLQNICKKDIDLSNKLLTLKDFKNNTTYKTFLTDDLNHLLEFRIKHLEPNDKIFKTTQEVKARTILNDLFNIGIALEDRKNKVVIHTLRHTFASHLAINGTPIFTIQKLMNHKDIKMTLRYAKLSPDSGRESILNLGL
ncbi:site-specific integrase [Aliarcobacter cryaerophilus]|uniref:tyrosine-type recombinase/integrase n=1 Tax=Aliarcobacter cryaerophilus TaxID=28198 RepID=UPI00164C70C0|nr:site-specific integrase [Aliarcobacter cryaerophilus]QNK84272.1 site-specific integrase [Aliarcobacter cryaerophilus]